MAAPNGERRPFGAPNRGSRAKCARRHGDIQLRGIQTGITKGAADAGIAADQPQGCTAIRGAGGAPLLRLVLTLYEKQGDRPLTAALMVVQEQSSAATPTAAACTAQSTMPPVAASPAPPSDSAQPQQQPQTPSSTTQLMALPQTPPSPSLSSLSLSSVSSAGTPAREERRPFAHLAGSRLQRAASAGCCSAVSSLPCNASPASLPGDSPSLAASGSNRSAASAVCSRGSGQPPARQRRHSTTSCAEVEVPTNGGGRIAVSIGGPEHVRALVAGWRMRQDKRRTALAALESASSAPVDAVASSRAIRCVACSVSTHACALRRILFFFDYTTAWQPQKHKLTGPSLLPVTPRSDRSKPLLHTRNPGLARQQGSDSRAPQQDGTRFATAASEPPHPSYTCTSRSNGAAFRAAASFGACSTSSEAQRSADGYAMVSAGTCPARAP